MKKKLSVLIVDDSVIFSEGLEQLLSHHPLVSKITLAHNYEKAFEFLQSKTVDVMILDLNFDSSDYDGFKIAEEVKNDFQNVRIIVLTQHAKVDHYEKLVDEYGVEGYLDKQLSVKQMFKAIEKVMAGENYIDANIRKMLDDGRWLKLSKREKEVLTVLSKGHTQKEAAAELFVEPKTIESHIRNLCQRFNANNSVELVSMYIRYKSAYREDYEGTTPPFKKI